MIPTNLEKDVVVAVASVKQLTELRTIKKIRLDHNKEFSDILRVKYDNNEEEINKNEDYEFDRVIYLGLQILKKEETGYEIIHKGKIADKRVLKKLGRIAEELSKINSYPKINALVLSIVLNKALGTMDPRSMRDYRKTVLYYCNIAEDLIDRCKDFHLGELNVSGFVKRIPRSYVVTG